MASAADAAAASAEAMWASRCSASHSPGGGGPKPPPRRMPSSSVYARRSAVRSSAGSWPGMSLPLLACAWSRNRPSASAQSAAILARWLAAIRSASDRMSRRAARRTAAGPGRRPPGRGAAGRRTAGHRARRLSGGGGLVIAGYSALGLDEPAGGVERGRPHLVEKLAEPGQALRPGAVEPPGAVAPLGEQPGVLEHGQVLADRGPGHVERRRDLAGGELVAGHEPQDGAPARLRERPEDLVGRLVVRSRHPAAHRCAPVRPTARP